MLQRENLPADAVTADTPSSVAGADPGPAPPARPVPPWAGSETTASIQDEPEDGVPLASGWPSPVPQPPGPIPVALGPLPSRSAAPLGGVLASDESAPEADRRDPSVVDLALLDLPVGRARGGLDAGTDPGLVLDAGVAGTPGSAREAVTALRGPGGFPLLGSSLLTEPQPGFGPLPRPAALTLTRASRVESAPGEPPASPTAADAPPDPAASSRARAVRRTSLFAGFTVAFALTLSLTFPDLTDPFRPDDGAPRSWVRDLKPKRRGR
jgi:hypothetical protein